MAYTPENNPYIPGDPYSYDLKWVVDQIKYAISLYEPLNQQFTDLSGEFDALEAYINNYFASLDLTEEVRANLDAMAADGSLSALIQPLFDAYKAEISGDIAVLQARMDTFASLPDGSTAGDAELADIRIGANGVTYPTAGDAVRAQVQILTDKIKKTLYNTPDVSVFEPGGISTANGASITGNNRLRVAIPVNANDLFSVEPLAGYSVLTFLYRDDNSYMSTWNGSQQTGTAAPWSTTEISLYNLPADAAKVRFALKKTDDSDMIISDAANLIFNKYIVHSEIDDLITDINTLAKSISENDNYIFTRIISGVNNNFRRGAIDGNGQNVDTTAYLNQSARMAFYKPLNDAEMVLSKVTQDVETDYYHYINFYDSSFAFISRSGGEQLPNVYAPVPANAVYFRTALTLITHADILLDNITSYSASLGYPYNKNIAPYLANKKGILLGDSIAYGVYSYMDGTDRKNSDGLIPDHAPKRISDYFAEMTGMTIDNIAARGTGYVADTRGLGNALVKANATDFADYDFVMLCFGVNDWIRGRTLGTPDNDTTGTVLGNLIQVLRKIYNDNPLAKVVIYTPFNTWGQVAVNQDVDFLYGTEETNYALGTTNTAGYTLQQLIDGIKTVAGYYGITCTGLGDSNVVNRLNIKDIMIDGLHPSIPSLPLLAAEMFAQKDFG